MSVNYEDPGQVSEAIANLTAEDGLAAVVGAETAAAIQAIAEEALKSDPDGGATIVNYTPGSTNEAAIVAVQATTLSEPVAAKAVIASADSTVDVTFGADSPVEYIVLGAAGSNKVAVESNTDVTIATQGGTNTQITSGGGSDTIILNGTANSIIDGKPVDGMQATATVNTGTGNDTVNVDGFVSAVITKPGGGNLTVNLGEVAFGSATINGGDGFDTLQLFGSRDLHDFKFVNGKLQMHSDFEVEMQNMNVVVFDTNNDNPSGGIKLDLGDQVAVIAQDAQDSMAAKLYAVALGRQPIDGTDLDANLAGLDYWMNEFANVHGTESAEALAKAFLACPEFSEAYAGLSNADFVSAMFANLSKFTDDYIYKAGGLTADQYIQNLNGGGMSRADVALRIAASDDAANILGIDGANYVIDDFGA